jgi:hypothetical protein
MSTPTITNKIISSSPASTSLSNLDPQQQLLAQDRLSNRSGKDWADHLEKTYIQEIEVGLRRAADPKDKAKFTVAIEAAKIIRDQKENLLPCLRQKKWTDRDLLQMIMSARAIFLQAPKVSTEIDRKWIDHLIHLMIKQLSPENSGDSCFFRHKNDNLTFSFGIQQGKWVVVDITDDLSQKATHFNAFSWGRSQDLNNNFCYTVLTNGNKVVETPFISVLFVANRLSADMSLAVTKGTSSVLKRQPSEIPYLAQANYCLGLPKPDSQNSLLFDASYQDFGNGYELRVTPKNGTYQYLYACEAIEQLRGLYVEKFLQNPKEHFSVTMAIVLPTTDKEAEERLLDVLELAVKNNDTLLIEYVIKELNPEFSTEELGLGSSLKIEEMEDKPLASDSAASVIEEVNENALASSSSEPAVEQIAVCSTTLAQVILNKRPKRFKQEKTERKVPLAQQKKARPIETKEPGQKHKNINATSNSRPLSNEELRATLGSMSLDQELLEQAHDLLDGTRLPNKEAETTFFAGILRARMVKEGFEATETRHGSHLRVVLKKGEKAFSVTLIDGHGPDKERGHSLSYQKNKLFEIFTPRG